MNTKIATTLFTFAAVLGFSENTQIVQPSANLPVELKAGESPLLKKSFGYLRMGVADPDAKNSIQALPGLGIGYRYGMVQSAFDISANYTRDEKFGPYETLRYTAPKISYLRYLSNDFAPQSFYFGAGFAWGEDLTADIDDFKGISANICAGLEMNRNQNFHSFIQFDVSHPAVAITSKSAKIEKMWRPLAEFSVGLGY